MEQGRAVKTAIARATEAIEAAEMMFAEETGATLNLSPAAKAALIAKIAAAIQAAVTEKERAPSSSFVKELLAKRTRVKAV
jgi:rhamnose utilization protein RhaD (predicted bifunctional aldolase and dehydrogenase)